MLQVVDLHFVVVQLLQQLVVLALQTLALGGQVVDVLGQVVDLVGQVARRRLVLFGGLLSHVLLLLHLIDAGRQLDHFVLKALAFTVDSAWM